MGKSSARPSPRFILELRLYLSKTLEYILSGKPPSYKPRSTLLLLIVTPDAILRGKEVVIIMSLLIGESWRREVCLGVYVTGSGKVPRKSLLLVALDTICKALRGLSHERSLKLSVLPWSSLPHCYQPYIVAKPSQFLNTSSSCRPTHQFQYISICRHDLPRQILRTSASSFSGPPQTSYLPHLDSKMGYERKR